MVSLTRRDWVRSMAAGMGGALVGACDDPRRTNPVTTPPSSTTTPPYLSGSLLGITVIVTSAPDRR